MRKWLKDIKKQKQLTQAQLALLIEVDTSSINKYELGQRRPSPEVAKKLETAIDFPNYGYIWIKFFEENQDSA